MEAVRCLKRYVAREVYGFPPHEKIELTTHRSIELGHEEFLTSVAHRQSGPLAPGHDTSRRSSVALSRWRLLRVRIAAKECPAPGMHRCGVSGNGRAGIRWVFSVQEACGESWLGRCCSGRRCRPRHDSTRRWSAHRTQRSGLGSGGYLLLRRLRLELPDRVNQRDRLHRPGRSAQRRRLGRTSHAHPRHERPLDTDVRTAPAGGTT